MKNSCYTSFDLNHRIEYSDRNVTTLKFIRGCSPINIDANLNGKYDDLKTYITVNVEGTKPSNYTTSKRSTLYWTSVTDVWDNN